MKIRSGFVSNSSSSSFIMRAAKFEKDELVKSLNITEDELEKCDDEDYEFYELVCKKLRDTDLSGGLFNTYCW